MNNIENKMSRETIAEKASWLNQIEIWFSLLSR
jgi:hypothetical protein